jgi:hypothetical protein
MAAYLRNILEARRTECRKEEVFAIKVAMDRVLVLRSIEGLVGAHVRHLASGIKEEQLLVTPEWVYGERAGVRRNGRNGMGRG